MDKLFVFIIFIIFFWFFMENDAVIFKITNVYCESYNKSWVHISECRLRAKSRNISALNITAHVKYPANNIFVHATLKKKANGYKPFLIDLKADGCLFMRRRNNPILKILLDLLEDFSTITHTCPYVGEQYVRDFYLRTERLKGLPLPTGEYLLLLTWIFDKNKPIFVTNVYFMFVEDLRTQLTVQH